MAEARNMEDEGGPAAAMCGGEIWLSRFVGDITCYRGMGPSYNVVIYVQINLIFLTFFKKNLEGCISISLFNFCFVYLLVLFITSFCYTVITGQHCKTVVFLYVLPYRCTT